MRGEQRRHRAVDRGHQLDRFHVGQLRQPEPAVLARDLDAERTERPQPLDYRIGDLSLAVDLVGIDLVPQEALQLLQERLRPPNLLGVLLGVRVDQRHAEAPEEQVADEARRDPVLFACRFGDLAGLVGADVALWRGERGHGCLPP